ncbi:MAG TPA: hypothetical protein VHM67_05050 [Gemmatimonadaceae bacterium]|nr:hypothetical protein [Gemmatimonadaceae bacterium]
MSSRSNGTARQARRVALLVELVLLAPRDGKLAVFTPADVRGRRALPAGTPRPGESLDDAAERIGRAALGASTAWLEQVGTRSDAGQVVVLYAGLVAQPPADDARWIDRDRIGTVAGAKRLVDDAARAIGAWLDRSPVAFRLLPGTFTLSELQEVYEILLGRTLHKASFRRALQSARLVTPTRAWRSEGRGRPAQLFRFAPRARKAARRGVRFDWLSD